MHSDADYSYESKRARLAQIDGYSELIGMHVGEGRIPYFINFMFNNIPGSPKRKMEAMTSEVIRVHDILARHTIRKPRSKAWQHLRPIFVGCPDLPVRKNDKELVRNLQVNGGLHFNVVALVAPHEPEHAVNPFTAHLKSRLKVSLKAHFEQCQRFYLNDYLSRIHVTPINDGTMADYTFKAFKWNRISSDDILVLN